MLPISVTAVQQYVHLQVSLVFLKYTVVTLQILDFYMVVNKNEFDINVINNEVVMMLLSTCLFLASLILLLYPDKTNKAEDSECAQVLFTCLVLCTCTSGPSILFQDQVSPCVPFIPSPTSRELHLPGYGSLLQASISSKTRAPQWKVSTCGG